MFYSSGSAWTSGVYYPSTFQPASRNAETTRFVFLNTGRAYDSGRGGYGRILNAGFFADSIFLQWPASQLVNQQFTAAAAYDPSNMDWGEYHEADKNYALLYAPQTLEENTGLLPIIPTQAEWDEPLRWQKWTDTRWSAQEDDTGLLPVIPLLAWDEEQQRWADTRATPLDDEFLYAPANYAPIFDPRIMDWGEYAEWTQSREVRVGVTTGEEEWSYLLPATPLAWDEYDGPAFDWSLVYGALASAMDDYDAHFVQSVGPGPSPMGRSARFGFTQQLHR